MARTKAEKAEAARVYFQKNKALIREKRRKKKRDNPEWAAEQGKKARVYALKWYHANKDDIKKKYLKRTRSDKRTQKDSDLRRTYGITIEDFEKMSQDQNGRCAICLKQKTLCVDHDHDTGKVRALLCRWCNIMLGNANDNPDTLVRGAIYLEENS